MHVSTSQDMHGPGQLALQHSNYTTAGGGWDLDHRAFIAACRVEDRADKEMAQHLGQWFYGTDSRNRPTVGDLTGCVFWEADTRKISTFSWIFPTKVVIEQAGAVGVGSNAVATRFTVETIDTRLAQMKFNVPKTWNRPPIGWHGYITSSTDENKQVELWNPADPRLIAANRGVDGAGGREYGQPVVDLNGREIDVTRVGVLGEILRVTAFNAVGYRNRYMPAIQGGYPSFFPVHGQTDTSHVAAFGSVAMGGPFSYISADGVHRQSTNKDNEGVGPLGIQKDALFVSTKDRDAPLEIRDNLYPTNLRKGQFKARVYCDYDPNAEHVNAGKRYKGLRKWWAETPWQAPTPVPVIQPSPGNQVPPEPPIIIIINNPPGGGGNPPGGGPGGGPNGGPNGGPAGDLLKTPHETGVPSLHGFDHRGSRFGGLPGFPGEPVTPDPEGRPTDKNGIPIDPDDPRLIGQGDPTGYLDGLGFPNGGGFTSRPEAPGQDAPNSPPQQTGGTTDPDAGDGTGGNEVGDAFNPLEPIDGSTTGAGVIDDAPMPQSIGGVEPGLQYWEGTSQFGWSIQTITARASNGDRISTYRPDLFFRNSSTGNGTAWFTAPEIVWGQRYAPSRFSQATFALWNGIDPTSAATKGKAAIFGALTPKQSTGGGVDGWYLQATGNSGSVNADFRFVDASGSARVGVTSHYGTFRVTDGSAGTPSLSFEQDADTGIYRGGANQINFTTSGTLRAHINTAALAPAGSSTTLGALSDPWAELYATTATISTLTVSAISTVPTWIKYTKTYTQLAAAATTNDIELFSLAAGGVVHAVKIKHSASFTGGAIAAYTVSVGIAGTLNKYIGASDIFAAPGNTVQYIASTVGTENHATAVSIRLAATSTGANLDQASAGSVDVWVLQSKAV